MRRILKFLSAVFVIVTLISTSNIYASTTDEARIWEIKTGLITSEGDNVILSKTHLKNSYTTVVPTFCVQHGVSLPMDGGYYNVTLVDMSNDETYIRLQKIAWFGYYAKWGTIGDDSVLVVWPEDQPHTEEQAMDWAYTQVMIWEELDQIEGVSSTYSSAYAEFKAEVERNIAAEDAKSSTSPSFCDQEHEVDMGETITLYDTNGVLSNYDSFDTTYQGVRFYHTSGDNNLYIEVTETCEIESLVIDKDLASTLGLINGTGDGVSYKIVFAEGWQTLFYTNYYPGTSYITLSLKINLNGNLSIKKTDEHGQPLSGIKFSVSGPAGTFELTTDENGEAYKEGIKYGTYTITETSTTGSLVLNNSSVDVYVAPAQTATYSMTNDYKRGTARIKKVDHDYGTDPTGDCELSGAVYGLYAAEDIYEGNTLIFKAVDYNNATSSNAIITVTTGDDGWAPVVKEVYSTILKETLDGIPLGKYYWKELESPEGYIMASEDEIDTNDKIEFEIKDTVAATVEYEPEVDSITENESIRGRIDVLKYEDDPNSSEEIPAAGVTLRLELVSDPTQYYEAVTDATGYAEFIDEDYLKYHPDEESTIPYGDYVIYEVKSADDNDYYYVQYYEVSITQNHVKLDLTILDDEAIPFKFKVVKVDRDTGETVAIEGVKFKIWDCANGEFVSQKVYPTETYYDEFSTNEDGYLILPDEVYTGKYIIYETSAPDGYYLDDEFRLPEDEDDYGYAEYGGKVVYVTKTGLGLDQDATYDPADELIFEVEMDNTPQKATITVYKTGEVLVGVTETSVLTSYSGQTDAGGEEITADVGDTLYTFNYEYQGLEGVTYEIEAAEDIVSSDGNYTYHKKGWTTTMTTGADGYATSEELYLGEYVVREIEVPEGYVLSDEEYEVTLEYEGEYVEVYDTDLEVQDTRQKLELTFKKVFEETKYQIKNYEDAVALFGVYTNTDMKINNVYVSKDSLVDLIWTDEADQVTSNVDLPEGTYYVKELYVTYPYTVSDEEIIYDLAYTDDATQEFVVYEGEDYVNSPVTAPLMLLKLSTSSANADGVLSLTGNELDEETWEALDNVSQAIYEAVADLTIDDALEYLASCFAGEIEGLEIDPEKVITVAGATYTIYTDEACTEPLYMKDSQTGEYTVEAAFTTDSSGVVVVEDLPYGVYYIKETEAPARYSVSDDIVEIIVNEVNGIPKVFQVTYDDSVSPDVPHTITKTDIFTGDVVPDCTFEITDEDGNVLVHATTDEDGLAYFPTDIFEDGQTYYYTEIDAPEIYELNTEAHEFVAQIDEETGEWIAEPIEVENVRKTSTVTLTKLDLMDSTPIPNCKFELRSLETDFVVEGVTDENGIYVFENIPYGEYTYTELEAPEEYQIDTTPHEITIDAEEITIQVTNQLVDTSDIQVVTLSVISIISMLGIVYVLKKKAIKV